MLLGGQVCSSDRCRGGKFELLLRFNALAPLFLLCVFIFPPILILLDESVVAGKSPRISVSRYVLVRVSLCPQNVVGFVIFNQFLSTEIVEGQGESFKDINLL